MTFENAAEKNILIVDDIFAARRIAKRLLQKLGFAHIDEAENGAGALEKLTSDQVFDLVIMDLNLKDMTAIDVLEKLAEQEDCQMVPIIIVTSDADRSVVVKAVELGAFGYLLKPFDAATLGETIAQVFNP